MSRSEKKQRKAFLNDFCAKFGIDKPNDPRISDADIVHIVYGEEKCREWLAQANGNFATWKESTNIKQARRVFFKRKRTKRKTRRNVSQKTSRKVKMRGNIPRKPVHKVGGRMPAVSKYVVGPDGVVISVKAFKQLRQI